MKSLRIGMFLASAVALVSLVASTETQATTYSCYNSTQCTSQASCDGTHYTSDGCSIQCYEGGMGGQLTTAGSANCSGGGGKPKPLQPNERLNSCQTP